MPRPREQYARKQIRPHPRLWQEVERLARCYRVTPARMVLLALQTWVEERYPINHAPQFLEEQRH